MLLRRLLAVVKRRLPFASQVERFRRQRQWLIDLDHLLELEQQPPPTSQSVSQTVDRYLTELLKSVQTSSEPEDQTVAAHINQVFRSFWWGLFVCYDVEALPRTNNELERCMRQIKMGQRRRSGRKNVHDVIIRYGPYLAFIDDQESLDELLARLHQVSHEDFLHERQLLDMALLQEQKKHRFRHHRFTYLAQLEKRWEGVVSQSAS